MKTAPNISTGFSLTSRPARPIGWRYVGRGLPAGGFYAAGPGWVAKAL